MCCVNKQEEIGTHHFRSMSLLKVYGGESNQSGGDEDDGRRKFAGWRWRKGDGE